MRGSFDPRGRLGHDKARRSHGGQGSVRFGDDARICGRLCDCWSETVTVGMAVKVGIGVSVGVSVRVGVEVGVAVAVGGTPVWVGVEVAGGCVGVGVLRGLPIAGSIPTTRDISAQAGDVNELEAGFWASA